VVVDALGHQRLQHIFDLADVYHCDNIDRVSDDFIRECQLPSGNFDNVRDCVYAIPSHWGIGKVYKRLILMVAAHDGTDLISTLETVYHSAVCHTLFFYF
jgi:hypothetical protein